MLLLLQRMSRSTSKSTTDTLRTESEDDLMFTKQHIHVVALLAAIGAGVTALSGELPTDLNELPLVILAISIGVTAGVNAYETNETENNDTPSG